MCGPLAHDATCPSGGRFHPPGDMDKAPVSRVNPSQASVSRLLADIVCTWASQMRAVLSADAVTMRDPSGLKAAEVTALSWPRRTAISLAVAASQMRAVVSPDAVTM